MSLKTASKTSAALMACGFVLWAYGFFTASFWYAETNPSLLDPVRLGVHDITGISLRPGSVEEVLGLAMALAGMVIRLIRR